MVRKHEITHRKRHMFDIHIQLEDIKDGVSRDVPLTRQLRVVIAYYT